VIGRDGIMDEWLRGAEAGKAIGDTRQLAAAGGGRLRAVVSQPIPIENLPSPRAGIKSRCLIDDRVVTCALPPGIQGVES